MKKKVSISIEESTLAEVEGRVLTGIFRNKSHLVELAVKQFLNNFDKRGGV